MEEEQFRFKSKREYEQAMSEMVRSMGQANTPPHRLTAKQEDELVERYESLVDEYIRFCSRDA